MAEGDKKANKFSLFSSSEEKYEKARDLYLNAATMYKASNNWDKVTDAYMKAGDMSKKNKEEMDLADDLHNAGLAMVKGKDSRSEATFAQVVEIYDKNGKYTQAAKCCLSIAELGTESSMDYFNRAAKYYKSEGSKATASEILIKMATVHIKRGEMIEARKIFEKAARDCLDDRLTRGMARKHFFMALLCTIAMLTPTNIAEGTAELEERFQEYTDLDTQFDAHTREHMLVAGIVTALEELDVEQYSDAMDDYDNICPLDDVKTKLLLRGKQVVRQAESC